MFTSDLPLPALPVRRHVFQLSRGLSFDNRLLVKVDARTRRTSLTTVNQPRPQGSLLSCARNSGTPGQAQRHSGFEWLYKRNISRPEPIRFVRLDSEHVQSDRNSVNRRLPELDLARGRDPRR